MRRVRSKLVLGAIGGAAALIAVGCAPSVLKGESPTLPGGLHVSFFGAAPQVSLPQASPLVKQEPAASGSGTTIADPAAPAPLPATSPLTDQVQTPVRVQTERVGHACPFSGG